MFMMPSGLYCFFNDSFDKGFASPYLWNLSNKSGYNAGVLPTMTSNPALGLYSAVISGMTLAPAATAFCGFDNYQTDPWTLLSTWTGQNSKEAWSQCWVYVPSVTAAAVVGLSLFCALPDWYLLGVLLNTSTGNLEAWYYISQNTVNQAVAACPLGQWFQITTHVKVASTRSSNDGVCQVWIGSKQVLNLSGLNNYYGNDGLPQYVWSWESYVENYYTPSNMTYYLDNVSLYAPAIGNK